MKRTKLYHEKGFFPTKAEIDGEEYALMQPMPMQPGQSFPYFRGYTTRLVPVPGLGVMVFGRRAKVRLSESEELQLRKAA